MTPKTTKLSPANLGCSQSNNDDQNIFFMSREYEQELYIIIRTFSKSNKILKIYIMNFTSEYNQTDHFCHKKCVRTTKVSI